MADTYTVFNASNLPVLNTKSFVTATQRLHSMGVLAAGFIELNGAPMNWGAVSLLKRWTATPNGHREPTADEITAALGT